MSFLEQAIRRGIRKGMGDAFAIAIPPIAAGILLTLMLRKRTAKKEGFTAGTLDIPSAADAHGAPAVSAEPMEPIVVMTRYCDAEIDTLISKLPDIATLTARELDVLREIMRGRKQSEVAHYLGIEVSTVKDFYKKIYTKLNVQNKDGLFLKISEILRN